MAKKTDSKEKTRYGDSELEEFRALIEQKLEIARSELKNYQGQLSNSNSNGTDDTATKQVSLEEGSATMEKEQISALAARQHKFIRHLENALIRISNKTYGICRETGDLISKKRLMAVPHATLSIEAKKQQK